MYTVFDILSMDNRVDDGWKHDFLQQKIRKTSYTEKHLKNIFETNNCRSVILIFPDNEVDFNIAKAVYSLPLPVYNINSSEIRIFNGPYHKVYHQNITIEESKIYILLLHNFLDVQLHIQKLQDIYFWRARDRVLVIMEQKYNKSSADELKWASKIFWKNQILNVAFLYAEKTFTCFTYNPFPQISIVHLKDCNLFYEKMTNLMGYRVNVSMFKNVLDAIPNNNEYLGKDGILAKTVMNFMNASCTYISPSDSVDYGENHNRKRITGAFADLVSGKTEIAFNSRYLKDEFQNYLEATYPHGRDDLTCLVPVVRDEDVKDFLSNFNLLIWFTFLAFVVSCSLCLFLITLFTVRKVDLITALSTVVAINLGQQAKYYSHVTSIRMTLLFCVFVAFFFNSAYQTKMTSLFTVPSKPKQMNTLKDLAKSDLKIYTLFRFKKMLHRNLNPDIRDRIVSKLVSMQEEEQINEINEHKNYAVICKDHIATYSVIQKENFVGGQQFYRIMNEKPMPSIVCYTVRYGSPLLPRVNTIINRLTEAGIAEQWRALTLHSMSVKGNIYQEKKASKWHMLTFTNLVTIFRFVVGGWIVSCAVLILEIFYYTYFDSKKRIHSRVMNSIL